MPTARWNGKILAQSDETQIVDGNHYFPLESLETKRFTDSSHTSFCPWKGTANYFNLVVDGDTNKDAAWIYRDPKEEALHIKDHVAFWRGVEVSDD